MTMLTGLGPVFYKLVYMSLTGLAAGAIVLLLRRLADKRFSPFWKYAMWLLVLAALVVPWRPQSRAAVLSSAEAVQEISFREDYNRAQEKYSAVLAQTQATPEIEAVKSEVASLRAKTLAFDALLPLLWLCGTAGAAMFMGIGAIRLRRKVKRTALACDMARYEALLARCQESLGIKRRVRVVLQSHVGTPALMGVFRPVILLPAYAENMSDARLEYVILHELSHLRRGDGLVNALLLVIRAVYWFNPLVWLLLKFVREDMELANDAAVLGGMGQEARKEYSLSLVEVLMGCGKQRHTMLCMTDGKKNIERRIGMIQLGEFFKRRKWVIAVAGVLVIAGIAALFLTQGIKTEQAGDQNALMTSLGYTREALEAIQKNKTPYVGENAKVGAIVYQLPVTWKGLAYDTFSLQTDEEPYGLTINYKEAAENSLSDFLDNPFSEAMEENNALLLFSAIENLGEVTFAMPGDMQSSQYTRGEISAIFGGIPSIDDLDAVYNKLSSNLKMEEFYFAHAGRLYLRTATPEDILYRNGEPDKIFVNESGLTVYEYHFSTSYTDPSGNTSTIDEATARYYLKDAALYATRTTDDAQESYADIIAKFGLPASEKTMDGRKYISYQLRRDEPGEPAKYAYFVFENDKVIESGWMLGNDFTVLSTAEYDKPLEPTARRDTSNSTTTAPFTATVSPSRTRPAITMSREIKQDGLVLEAIKVAPAQKSLMITLSDARPRRAPVLLGGV